MSFLDLSIVDDRTMIIAQITDCHVAPPGALVGRVDTSSTLRRTVDHLNTMVPLPDVVLVTGDLANDGFQVEYDRIGEILAGLTMPMFVVPGNHDDRTRLRALFPNTLPPGGPDDPIDYVIDEFEVRLVGLDTSSPGLHGGFSNRTNSHGWMVCSPRNPTSRPSSSSTIRHSSPASIGWTPTDSPEHQNWPTCSSVIDTSKQWSAGTCTKRSTAASAAPSPAARRAPESKAVT